MKCLTIQQPYAWAIFRAGKDVENRHDRRGEQVAKRVWNGLGPRLIHTSQRYAGADAYRTVRDLAGFDPGDPGAPKSDVAWAFGSIIGRVQVVGVHHSSECFDAHTGRYCSPWAEQGAAHIQLAAPTLLHHPIPQRGQLGSWAVTDHMVLARIGRELA